SAAPCRTSRTRVARREPDRLDRGFGDRESETRPQSSLKDLLARQGRLRRGADYSGADRALRMAVCARRADRRTSCDRSCVFAIHVIQKSRAFDEFANESVERATIARAQRIEEL